MLIYKIFRADEWAQLKRDGETKGAPIDIADGFVHFSTGSQVGETARRYFAGADGLVVATVDTDLLGEHLVWEPSRGGDLFPHLYREMRLSDVIAVSDLPRLTANQTFPDLP